MEQAKLVRLVLWCSMLVAVAIYALMPLVITPSRPPMDDAETLRLVLAAAAFGCGAAGFAARRFLLQGPLASGAIDLASPEGQQRVLVGYALTWVMSEAVGVLGLVLFMLTSDVASCWAFAAASAVLLLLHVPRDSDLEGAPPAHALPDRPDPIG